MSSSEPAISLAPVSLASAVARIRAFRVAMGWAPYRYAVLAGVGDASTRAMDHDSWKPSLRTLEKMEALIPAGWQVGDAPPAGAEGASAAASAGEAA